MTQPNWEIEWKKVEDSLIATQEEFEDRNGLDYCKNCGTDYRALNKEIKSFIQKSIQQAREEVVNDILGMASFDGDVIDMSTSVDSRTIRNYAKENNISLTNTNNKKL